MAQGRITHGHTRGGLRPREYNSWKYMNRRCRNKNCRAYKNYGGRGISVCDRWTGVDGFQNFLADMGPCPDGCELDRQDNNGNYEPSNCRWATAREQVLNRRTTVTATIDGVTKPLSYWLEELGIPYRRGYKLYWRGRSPEAVIQFLKQEAH